MGAVLFGRIDPATINRNQPLSAPPPNASSYEQVCLRPLPENSFLDAVVKVDTGIVDFYYHQERQPGADTGGRKWVCRTRTYQSQTGHAGDVLSKVENIDPSKYEAQPSKLPGFPNVDPEKILKDFKKAGIFVAIGLGSLAVLAVVLAVRK